MYIQGAHHSLKTFKVLEFLYSTSFRGSLVSVYSRNCLGLARRLTVVKIIGSLLGELLPAMLLTAGHHVITFVSGGHFLRKIIPDLLYFTGFLLHLLQIVTIWYSLIGYKNFPFDWVISTRSFIHFYPLKGKDTRDWFQTSIPFFVNIEHNIIPSVFTGLIPQ